MSIEHARSEEREGATPCLVWMICVGWNSRFVWLCNGKRDVAWASEVCCDGTVDGMEEKEEKQASWVLLLAPLPEK